MCRFKLAVIDRCHFGCALDEIYAAALCRTPMLRFRTGTSAASCRTRDLRLPTQDPTNGGHQKDRKQEYSRVPKHRPNLS